MQLGARVDAVAVARNGQAAKAKGGCDVAEVGASGSEEMMDECLSLSLSLSVSAPRLSRLPTTIMDDGRCTYQLSWRHPCQRLAGLTPLGRPL